ncbi:hypothetical protein M407DRAFT_3750 [Tulasnella calospora MUT 4182]|uniref:Pentacotripeptide-repeat region of PRORP domain-containing protein n=1 Tax=Tulasnella calospora MUT 4182 TaxID=1051891 RepID=A0A0C3QW87_9AGAM|nr:hypothetical protein M407DRAFT_3750 [Tulasnella calospora MUT 4182]
MTAALPHHFKSLYRSILRASSAAVLHHSTARTTLRKLYRPLFGEAASKFKVYPAASEQQRQEIEPWMRQWNDDMDQTLEFLVGSATNGGIPHKVTRNITQIAHYRSKHLSKDRKPLPWNPQLPAYAYEAISTGRQLTKPEKAQAGGFVAQLLRREEERQKKLQHASSRELDDAGVVDGIQAMLNYNVRLAERSSGIRLGESRSPFLLRGAGPFLWQVEHLQLSFERQLIYEPSLAVDEFSVASSSTGPALAETSTKPSKFQASTEKNIATSEPRALPKDFFAPYGRIPPPPTDAVKVNELLGTLSASEYTPDIVWERYRELDHVSRDRLPLNLYRGVLRRCTLPPYTFKQRVAEQIRQSERLPSTNLHPLEERLLAVLDAMKVAGYQVEVEDYNYVMEHYAMAGHYRGARKLLDEMELTMKKPPPAETFDYACKAIALHATLPIRNSFEPARRTDLTRAFTSLLEKMKDANLGYTTAVFAAMIPMYRLMEDLEGMERALKLGFGFDIANPDKHPPEFLERVERIAEQAVAAGQAPPIFPHITTSILNNIIIAYGQIGEVAKMITAFEVLTAPLPLPSSPTPTTNEQGFDEEEDDAPIFHDHLHPSETSSLSPSVLASRPCRPNSRTYQELIRWCSLNESLILAQHYLRVALNHDREVDAELRNQLRYGDGPVWSPPVAVSWTMFRKVYMAAHSKGKTHVIKWLERQANEVLRWKRDDMAWYSQLSHDTLARRGMIDRKFESSSSPESVPVLASLRPTLHGTESDVQLVTKPFNRLLHGFVLKGQIRRFEDGMPFLSKSAAPRTKESSSEKEEIRLEREKREMAGLAALKRSVNLRLSPSG